MTSPSDFGDLFDSCKTFRDSNEAYRQGVTILQEAHRLCMSRLVKERDSDAVVKRKPSEPSEGPLVAKSRDVAIRNWALSVGHVLKRNRVNKEIRAMYDEAHRE